MSNRRQKARRRESNRPVFCDSGKTAWATKKGALSSKSHVEKKCDVPLAVYKCRLCNHWHLTSSVTRTRPAGAMRHAFA